MEQQLLLQNAEQYVREFFSKRVDRIFSFHSIHHTEGVVEAATAMADYYTLEEEDRTALLLAAWFHDTGYSKGESTDHEIESQKIAAHFFENRHLHPELVQKVKECIAATKVPQNPKTLIEQIICDADLHHLGTESFREENKLLRKELKDINGGDLSKKEWRKQNITFLEQHQYFTEYALKNFDPVKQENLRALKEKENGKQETEEPHKPLPVENKTLPVAASSTDETLRNKSPHPVDAQAIEKPKKEKTVDNKTDRSIGTMFRIMSDNHVSLSQMADSKANIMISVNTIVLSIMVSVLFSKLQYYPQFIIPTILLCTVSVTAIVFAILATRPNVNKGTFHPEDIKQKKVNLLFFGNFFKMQLPDYEWAMKEMMNDKEYLYGSMIKDIYYLGKVLAKKYKFLRLSYNIFMFGLIISMLAFVIAFWV